MDLELEESWALVKGLVFTSWLNFDQRISEMNFTEDDHLGVSYTVQQKQFEEEMTARCFGALPKCEDKDDEDHD